MADLLGKGNLSPKEIESIKNRLENMMNQEKPKKAQILWKPTLTGGGILSKATETWNQKYFVLTDTGVLYYDHQGDASPKKQFTHQNILGVWESSKLPNIKGTYSVFEIWTADDNWWCACPSKKERDEWIHAVEIVQNFKTRREDFKRRYKYLEEIEVIANNTEKAREYIAGRNQRQQAKKLTAFDAYTLRMEVTTRKQNPDFGLGQKQLQFDWVSGGWTEGMTTGYSLQGYVVLEAITECVARKGITELSFKKGDRIELLAWPSKKNKIYDWVGRVNGVEGNFNLAWPKKYVNSPPGKWLHQAWLLEHIVEFGEEFRKFLNPQETEYLKTACTALMFHYQPTLAKNEWAFRVVNGILHCFGNVVDQTATVKLQGLRKALQDDGFEVDRRVQVYSGWESGWKSEVHRALGVESVDLKISTNEIANSPRLDTEQRMALIYYINTCAPRGLVKALTEMASDKLLGNKLKSLRTIHVLFKTSLETLGKKYIWFGPNDTMYFSVGLPEKEYIKEVPLSAPFNPQEGTPLEIHPDYFYCAYANLAKVSRDKSIDRKKVLKSMKDGTTLRDQLHIHKVTAREFRKDNPVFQTTIYANYVQNNEFSL